MYAIRSYYENTFGGVIKTFSLLRALQTFFPINGQILVINKIRQNRFVMIKKRVHIHDQIPQDF